MCSIRWCVLFQMIRDIFFAQKIEGKFHVCEREAIKFHPTTEKWKRKTKKKTKVWMEIRDVNWRMVNLNMYVEAFHVLFCWLDASQRAIFIEGTMCCFLFVHALFHSFHFKLNCRWYCYSPWRNTKRANGIVSFALSLRFLNSKKRKFTIRTRVLVFLTISKCELCINNDTTKGQKQIFFLSISSVIVFHIQ